jgi:hypothetical protein
LFYLSHLDYQQVILAGLVRFIGDRKLDVRANAMLMSLAKTGKTSKD